MRRWLRHADKKMRQKYQYQKNSNINKNDKNFLFSKKKLTSSGGLEPPTFRLTVERANQLRHEDLHVNLQAKLCAYYYLKHSSLERKKMLLAYVRVRFFPAYTRDCYLRLIHTRKLLLANLHKQIYWNTWNMD